MDESGKIFGADFKDLALKEIVTTSLRDPNCFYPSGNTVFVGKDDGLYKYNILNNSSVKLYDGTFTKIMFSETTNKIYALSTKTLYELTNSFQPVFTLANEKREDLCFDFEIIDSLTMFIATTNGLYEINDGEQDYYSKKSSLPSASLYSLYYNKYEDALFVGSGDKGLLKLQFKNCYSFSTNEGFGQTCSLSSLIKTKEGKVLIAESSGTLFQMGADTTQAFIKDKKSYTSLQEVEDVIWAGTWGGGAFLIRNNEIVDSIYYPKHLPDNTVHCVLKDAFGNIWVGTENGLARGKDVSSIRPALQKEVTGHIITLYELKDHRICVGGSKGAFIVDQKHGTVNHIGESMGLKGREVRCFKEDNEGKIWMGTYGGGLYCYHKNKLTNINEIKNSCLDKDVFCIAEDTFGYYYITSNHGLWRLNIKALNEFYYGRLNHLIPFHYNEESGILNAEFNGGFQNNYLRTKSGHFYFPTLQGIVVTTPEEPISRKLKPIINQIIINDTLADLNIHTLEKETYSVQFKFSCVNFSNKLNIYYQYKLKGSDNEEWSSLQKSTIINFKLLPPGKYVFYIRAIGGFNDKNPEEVQFAFEVLPYFYETLWFKTTMVAIISIVVFLIMYFRVKAIRKKQLEHKKNKRRFAELELNVLLAQMNPHFIFNSLNSLKYFLNVNDLKKADEFLDHFSFLLRKVMIYSSEKFISLSEETALLHAYIELEKIRLNDRFVFTIEMEEAISEKLIPTFIIQPFVENAIKHGFVNSSEKCNLHISFTRSGNTICCIVDDDGVGRKKAEEMKQGSMAHESKGISNVRERMAIKKNAYGKEISIKIIDKKDELGNSKGTRVIINIEEI